MHNLYRVLKILPVERATQDCMLLKYTLPGIYQYINAQISLQFALELLYIYALFASIQGVEEQSFL